MSEPVITVIPLGGAWERVVAELRVEVHRGGLAGAYDCLVAMGTGKPRRVVSAPHTLSFCLQGDSDKPFSMTYRIPAARTGMRGLRDCLQSAKHLAPVETAPAAINVTLTRKSAGCYGVTVR